MSYDVRGIFRKGFSKSEVENILGKAKKVFLEGDGSQIVSWSSSGHQSTNRLSLSADQLIEECVYALQLLDPENYPPDTDRTQVAFHDHGDESTTNS